MFNMVSVNCKCIKQNKHGHSTKCFLYENEKKKMTFKILLNLYLKRIQLILVKKCDGYIEIKLQLQKKVFYNKVQCEIF